MTEHLKKAASIVLVIAIAKRVPVVQDYLA